MLYSPPLSLIFFFFNDTATTEIYTLSLHDALPIWNPRRHVARSFHISARIAGPVHYQRRRLDGWQNRASVDLPVHLFIGIDGRGARGRAHITSSGLDDGGIHVPAQARAGSGEVSHRKANRPESLRAFDRAVRAS